MVRFPVAGKRFPSCEYRLPVVRPVTTCYFPLLNLVRSFAMFDHILPIVILLSLAAFGFRSLHLFASSNGLLTHLERCITNATTPGGKPLRTLTTNGRFPRIDLQLRAVAVFLLIFCEDLENPDADVVGFSFAANWGASWILIVLESLREYSRTRFMSWYVSCHGRLQKQGSRGLIVRAGSQFLAF